MTDPPDARLRWRDRLRTPAGADVLGLTVLWLGMVALAWPAGDFPLNDDWLYALTVRSLREDGTLWLRDWAAAPAVTQVLWGTLFTLPAGFSFTALRLSTLVLGLAGVLGTYALLRPTTDRPTARLGAFALAANPLYFNLAGTFMTDVPFAACAVLALLAYLRALERPEARLVLLATALAVAATLIRQLGLALPLGFGVAFALRHGLAQRRWLTAVAPAAAVLGALLAFEALLGATTGVPAQYEVRAGYLTDFFLNPSGERLRAAAARYVVLGLYTGLFSLPLVATLRPARSGRARGALLGAAGAAGLVGAALAWQGARLPLAPNVLHAAGLGPPTLHDAYLGGAPLPTVLPPGLWLVLTAAAVVSVGGLVFAALRALTERRPPALLMLATLAALALPLGLGPLFDRYAVALVAPALVLTAAAGGSRRGRQAGWLIALVFATFSVAATHDYGAWNRARWRAIGHVLDEHALAPARLDGGYEYNGWQFYDRHHAETPGGVWRWGARPEADYAVSFGPMDGFEIVAEFEYVRWLPPGRKTILALRRRAMPGAAH